jgi:hypothetical protein
MLAVPLEWGGRLPAGLPSRRATCVPLGNGAIARAIGAAELMHE